MIECIPTALSMGRAILPLLSEPMIKATESSSVYHEIEISLVLVLHCGKL